MSTTRTSASPGQSGSTFDQLDVLSGEQPLPRVLETLVEVASAALPVDVHTSITLVRRDEARTAAFSGKVALDLDEKQYELGHGPCLDAANAGEVIHVRDMQSETRWAQFAAAAAQAGIKSSLSLPLPVQRQLTGALNIYSPQHDAFDPKTIATAEGVANHAAVAVATAHLYETAATLALQMRQAMESRATIEQAKGILMRDNHCSPEAAFEMLVKLSQTSHLKLREVAAGLIAHFATGT